MSVRVDIGGRSYDFWENAEVIRDMTTISGAFSMSVSAEPNKPFPIRVQDKVKIYINNHQVIDGWIDKISPSYSSSSHTISIQGRDKTCDIIDSSLNGSYIFTAPVSLSEVVRRVARGTGVDCKVINKAGFISFRSDEIAISDRDETAFSFIDKYCKKKQVLATTDGSGNIVLTRAASEMIPCALVNLVNGKNNNILSASADIDFSNRFYEYNVLSQSNFSATSDIQAPSADSSARSTDRDIRRTRILNTIQKESLSPEECRQSSKWIANIRRSESITYRCTVANHTYNPAGDIWEPNRLVRIDDDFCNVRSELLLTRVVYRISASESTTDLTFMQKDAYTLKAEKELFDYNKNSDNFINSNKEDIGGLLGF